MIVKKICMLGAFSVGKTSLVERYVHSIFSDQYLSTVGVKISKKSLAVDGLEVSLVLLDMEGKDDYSEINLTYLRGAMGYFLVADGTRRETLDFAVSLRSAADRLTKGAPHILLVNKADLASSWEVKDADFARLEKQDFRIIKTSAKAGLAVEKAFNTLTKFML